MKHGTVPNHQYDTPFTERKEHSVHLWRESVCVFVCVCVRVSVRARVCALYMCECLFDSTVPLLLTSPIQSVL